MDITLPTRRLAPHPGVRIHRGRVTARESIDGIPVTNAGRTLLDIAASVGGDELEAMVDEAVSRGLTTIAGLEWELAMTGGPGRIGSAALRRAMSHLSDGHCESYLENKVLRILLKASLPMPVRQHEIRAGSFTARVDFAYPAAKLAIEVDGYRHHGSRRAFDSDRRRDNQLHALGWLVIRVSDRLLRDPTDFIEPYVQLSTTDSSRFGISRSNSDLYVPNLV